MAIGKLFLIANVKSAPFNSRQWWRKIREAGKEFSKLLTPDAPLIANLIWPRVCWDRGWFKAHETNREACQRWLDGFFEERGTMKKGGVLARCQWSGTDEKLDELLIYWDDLLLSLSYILIVMGKVLSLIHI